MTSLPLQVRAAAELERRKRNNSDKLWYQDIRAALPTPHDRQREIIESTAKRKVVCTGRRFGKTLCGGLMAVNALLDGKKVLIASTSQDQSDVFWSYLKRWLAPLYTSGQAYKNETKRIIELPNGGAIKVKTGSDADVLRGFDADLLILDECAYLEPTAWYEVGAPMMADRDGTAVFFSTPLRRNWFYALYNKAIGDDSGRWQSWHATTLSNPHLSQTAVAELISDMTEEAYKQEILAEFLEGQGQVFRNIEACATAHPVTPYRGHFVFGVDLAQTVDYSVITVLDKTTRSMVDFDRFNRQSWAITRARIKALYERWQPDAVWVESNSVGSPNAEALQADGLPVYMFETTASSKSPLIESLVLAFERGEIEIFNNPVFMGELGAYERKVSRITGRSQYSAPEGMHDDCVMSLAICWHGAVSLPMDVVMGKASGLYGR